MNLHKKIVICHIIIYTAIFTTLTYGLHEKLYLGWDLGLQENFFWNTITGEFFYSDEFGFNGLGMHFNIIFILMLPFYYLIPNTIIILLIQTLTLSFGIIPLYLILKRNIHKSKIVTIILISYTVCPFIWISNLYDFHPIKILGFSNVKCFLFLRKKQLEDLLCVYYFATFSKRNNTINNNFLRNICILQKK